MTLTPGKLILAKDYPADADVKAYVAAVEAADGQSLELEVIKAYDNFILGCKHDGIWNAIKASCILAGARTLSGALVPLVGTAPTNNGPFVAADYNRKTGLVGDGSSKYLDSNELDATALQDNVHFSIYVNTLQSVGGSHMISSGLKSLISKTLTRNHESFGTSYTQVLGFCGTSRSNSTGYILRNNLTNVNATVTSIAPDNVTFHIFKRRDVSSQFSDARLAFYSIGEALDLALLDARVSTLISDLGAAIP